MGWRWHDAPKGYDPHKTIYNRFIRWSRLGVFNRILAELIAKRGKPEQLMIDATHLKAHSTTVSLIKTGMFPDVDERASEQRLSRPESRSFEFCSLDQTLRYGTTFLEFKSAGANVEDFALRFYAPLARTRSKGNDTSRDRIYSEVSQTRIPNAAIVFSSPTAVVLTDIGLTLAQRLDRLEIDDINAHENLVISAAADSRSRPDSD